MDEHLDDQIMSDKHEEIADEAYERGYEAGILDEKMQSHTTDGRIEGIPWCNVHDAQFLLTGRFGNPITCVSRRLYNFRKNASLYEVSEEKCVREDAIRHWYNERRRREAK